MNDLQEKAEMAGKSFFDRQNHVKNVTIAIGMIRKGCVILAADSQTTEDKIKRKDSLKINVIEFANAKALVTYAGSVALGEMAIDILRRKAADTIVDKPETIMVVAQETVREVRLYQVALNKDIVTDWVKFFWENNPLELLVGYYYKDQPHLYVAEIYRATATAIKNHVTIGIGRELGDFLLAEYAGYSPENDGDFGMALAVYVVEKVKDFVNGCGGKTRLGVATDEGKCGLGNEKRIADVVKMLVELDEPAKAERNKKIYEMLNSVVATWQNEKSK